MPASFGEADTTLALEGAYVNGPFSAQGEWAHVDVDGVAGDAFRFAGPLARQIEGGGSQA